MRSRALGLGLCAALGCGAATEPAHPTLTGSTKHYSPLAMRDDARQPGQAVILGSDSGDGSMVLPLPATATSVVVDAMLVSHGAGALVAITLSAQPAAPGATGADVRGVVPASETAAARWNTGLWSAAQAAASALGKDLPDLAFAARPAGAPDGVAAPALIAAGWLAALTGEPIDPAVTLAGALDPDGTLGPVAGLPEQLAAAIARGKTRIGFPSGQRLAISEATGKPVDVVQLARAHHAEAVELATVYDAYQLLTHKKLPAPVPVGELDMALDADAARALEALRLDWQQRLAGEWAALLQLEQAGRLPPAIRGLVRRARAHAERGEALTRAGKPVAAAGELATAWRCAAAANRTRALVAQLGRAAGSLDDARAQLATGEPELPALLQRIAGAQPASLAGHLAMLAALDAALRGWADQAFAAGALAAANQLVSELHGKPAAELSAPATIDAAANAIAPVVGLTLEAQAAQLAAAQALGLLRERGNPYAGAPDRLARVAAALEAQAMAALAEADALIVEPLARAGVTREQARLRAGLAEPDLVIASALARVPDGVPHELVGAWGDGALASQLLAITGSTAALRSAHMLIARHAMLGVQLDAAGQAIAVAQPEALRQLLVSSARSARAAARAARVATGEIPLAAKLAYQRATAEAGGGIDDQLAALADLWAASDASQLAVTLARN